MYMCMYIYMYMLCKPHKIPRATRQEPKDDEAAGFQQLGSYNGRAKYPAWPLASEGLVGCGWVMEEFDQKYDRWLIVKRSTTMETWVTWKERVGSPHFLTFRELSCLEAL